MEQAAADAKYARLHEARKWHNGNGTSWGPEPSDEHPYRYNHGLTIGVADSDIRPDDKFLTEEHAPFVPAPPTPDDESDEEGDSGNTP